MTIKITIKDAEALATAIAKVTEHAGRDNPAVRAIIQQISFLLPEKVSASSFRCEALSGLLDLSGRDYLAEIVEGWGPWIDWTGGEQPVDDDTLVQCHLRGGEGCGWHGDTLPASAWAWGHDCGHSDIVRYRVATEG